jgi:GNAT superfamily N-acetyltransferase
MKLTYKKLDTSTWNDFVELFGERGACGGCWCMAWRQSSSEYAQNKGEKNKRAMKKLVMNEEQLGIIAYHKGKPIGWCAVAPRESYSKLESSRVLKRIDDAPVWSIPCFFLAKEYRRKGLSSEILRGVILFCKKKKVKVLEAYPIIPYSENMPAPFAWTGMLSSFLKAGFVEEKRWSKARPIVRCYL